MSDLRARTIRLAHSNPELRDRLLPLLKNALEGPLHKPGDVWHTDGGKWRGMNLDGKPKTFDDQDKAKSYAKGSGPSKKKETGKSDADSAKLKEMTGFSSTNDVTKAWTDTYDTWMGMDKDTKKSPQGKQFGRGMRTLGKAVDSMDAWSAAQRKLIELGDDLEKPDSSEGKALKSEMDKLDSAARKHLDGYNDEAKGYTGFKGKLKKLKDTASSFAKGLVKNLRGKKACDAFDHMTTIRTASAQQEVVLLRKAIRVAYDNPTLQAALVPVLVEHLCNRNTQ